MGLANKVLEEGLVDLKNDDTDPVDGVTIDHVLAFMRENKIIKIVRAADENTYRLVFPINVSKLVYQRKIK